MVMGPMTLMMVMGLMTLTMVMGLMTLKNLPIVTMMVFQMRMILVLRKMRVDMMLMLMVV